ncbi:MAG: hypothetical protein ACYSX0_19965 [Planctomycetota bacterium]
MTAPGETPAMLRILCCFLALAPIACHGFFGGRTTEEDQKLKDFADARQRAATYYDGKDYYRAASQYKQALDLQPDHTPSHLGYAYSLMYTNLPQNLVRAQEEFENVGDLKDQKLEVKRIFGLALTHRTLAAHYQRRSRIHDQNARIRKSEEDGAVAKEHASSGITYFEQVFELDEALAASEQVAPFRVSASLTPDAHAGIAHCEIILADNKNLEHLDRALEHVEAYARVAANARRFWEQRRERTMITDPLREGEEGDPNAAALQGQWRQRYEEKIRNTIEKEVAMRRALVETFAYLNRFADGIKECEKVLELDNSFDEALFHRGRFYALLTPPDYRSALKDLKAYRARQDLSRLTEELVGLNRRIKDYEKKFAEQQAKKAD